jgi:HTH-type transcriptional regulator, cell division transcriptional repressor
VRRETRGFPDPVDLARRIRASREAKGLTQDAIARAFGIRRNAVTSWELGIARPSKAKLPKLADILDVEVEWLGGTPLKRR